MIKKLKSIIRNILITTHSIDKTISKSQLTEDLTNQAVVTEALSNSSFLRDIQQKQIKETSLENIEEILGRMNGIRVKIDKKTGMAVLNEKGEPIALTWEELLEETGIWNKALDHEEGYLPVMSADIQNIKMSDMLNQAFGSSDNHSMSEDAAEDLFNLAKYKFSFGIQRDSILGGIIKIEDYGKLFIEKRTDDIYNFEYLIEIYCHPYNRYILNNPKIIEPDVDEEVLEKLNTDFNINNAVKGITGLSIMKKTNTGLITINYNVLGFHSFKKLNNNEFVFKFKCERIV